ncbi:MAG: hypothetical protein JXM68_04705 [Sedimentisphaerales bacterium]|nr:hypothetical protein [Sedimentisphaerales bacterium]
MNKIVVAVIGMMAMAGYACAGTISRVFSFDELRGDLPGKFLYAAVADGSDIYCHFYGYLSSKPEYTMSGITRIDGNGQSHTLVSGYDWFDHVGSEKISALYNFSISGDSLYFADLLSKQVYSVNKNTGAISTLATSENISKITGLEQVAFLGAGDAHADKMYFFERNSRSIMRAGLNGVELVLSEQEMISLTGSSAINGSMTVSDDSHLYWCGGELPTLYSLDMENGAVNVLLTNSEICAAGRPEDIDKAVNMQDIYHAPDGNLYFFDRNRGIMSYSADSDTLSVVASAQELSDSEIGMLSAVYNFTWYEDSLAFCHRDTGFYVVTPEPLTIMILAAGSGLVLRRRKSRV